MAMSKPCDGCGEVTSYICVAQFRSGTEEDSIEKIICKSCWDAGKRCWWFENGELVVSENRPPEGKRAALYWDEGGYVTDFVDGTLLPTYPDIEQPNANKD